MRISANRFLVRICVCVCVHAESTTCGCWLRKLFFGVVRLWGPKFPDAVDAISVFTAGVWIVFTLLVEHSIDFEWFVDSACSPNAEYCCRLHFMTLNRIVAGAHKRRGCGENKLAQTTEHSNSINMAFASAPGSRFSHLPHSMESHFSHFPISFVDFIPNARPSNSSERDSLSFALFSMCRVLFVKLSFVKIHWQLSSSASAPSSCRFAVVS